MKEQLNKSRDKRKELIDKLQLTNGTNNSQDLKDKLKYEQIFEERDNHKHEMEAMVMKMTKEVETSKNLEQSLKGKYEEYHKLNCNIGQLQLDLEESKYNEQDLARVNEILRKELTTTNEVK